MSNIDYHDKDDPSNSPKYHTGKECVEPGCHEPAGTAWGPRLCWKCNAERMDRITKGFEDRARRGYETLDA